jgi:hypothetical protein
MRAIQTNLFDDDEQIEKRKKRGGGSSNPIVFHDYESYIAKFEDKEKTTDDTYTPQDVYEAVVRYVGTVTDLTGKVILRPFYPGGDYENAEYPENGVVIDNPPFSLFKKICVFYASRNIPFFLFGPGMTIMCICDVCTAVFINRNIKYENKADVRTNFASNLYGDIIATTAPELDRMIGACESQNKKVNLPKFRYPAHLVSASDMHTICGGGIEFSVKRASAEKVCKIGARNLFGDHLLCSTQTGAAKEAAKEAAKDIKEIKMSERDIRTVEYLDKIEGRI